MLILTMVKLLNFFVVGILLFNLGATLVADIFEKEAHIALTSEEVNNYRKHNIETGHDNLGCESKSPVKGHCPDPCHLGQPHFGHSAFFGSTSAFNYVLYEPGAPAGFEKKSFIDDPFLEGRRRPPKTA